MLKIHAYIFKPHNLTCLLKRLIQNKNLTRISIKEQLELKFHMAGCSVCRLFEQQSLLINKIVKKHFFIDKSTTVLDENFKKISLNE